MEREVTLMEMLDAREARARRQRELLEKYGLPLISFSLNIAGPVKNGPVLRRVFREGLDRLSDALRAERIEVKHQEEIDEATGCEALLAVRGDARTVKALCAELEAAVPSWDELDELDWAFIQRNLSPGGCADLLAITYFLHFCIEEGAGSDS